MSTGQPNLPPRARSNAAGQKKKASSRKKRSPIATLARWFLIVCILVILGGAAYVGSLYLKAEDTILSTGNNNPVPPEKSASVKPLTMLILGTDYRPEHQTYLTDVVMVAAMNPETNTATLVSLPRDTSLQLKGYRSDRKLNSFYTTFRNLEKQGEAPAEERMKDMLGQYFDIPIDYVTVLDFQGFRDVVDALGGVDVNVQYNMCHKDSQDGTHINLKAGPQSLDGKEALDYVRYRKSMNCEVKTKESNDFDRNARQSEVLHSLIDQMKSFGGAVKAYKVLDAVGGNMTTDLENDQMKNIMKTYYDINKKDVRFVPITGQWRSPFVYINGDELQAAKQALQDELAGKHSKASEEAAENSASGS
ncbi:LCP family protein [Paenibacillus sp. F411]|uniref:LCP family protein n=1 Tax=Paenibacillus TaxID=44249 RepID=UPI0010FDF90F|nr:MULTISPECIES: LCP family protein [Paenibacillus]MBO2943230.1 LCP family protein [Paenibacillus sp. F411]